MDKKDNGSTVVKVIFGVVAAGYVLWHTHKDGYVKGMTNTAKAFLDHGIGKREEKESEK